MSEDRYNVYSKYLVKKFGAKVYKIPVNLAGTCPNRDGSKSFNGCIFCDEEGSGFNSLPTSLSVEEQVRRNINYFAKRYKAEKFIVYLQSFTNTYRPLEKFKDYIEASLVDHRIVGISVSTRPDCISEEYLEYLEEISREKSLEIDIELGLQTVNYHTLDRINRGHGLAEFIDAVLRIKKRQFSICSHIILNLPWDTERDVIECAKVLSALDIDYVKLHSLYIVEGTELGAMYERGEIEIISREEYVDRAIIFLEYLSPDIVVQRLLGKGPRQRLLFGNWDTSWWKIKEEIESELEARGTRQGNKCDYLNGQALNTINI